MSEPAAGVGKGVLDDSTEVVDSPEASEEMGCTGTEETGAGAVELLVVPAALEDEPAAAVCVDAEADGPAEAEGAVVVDVGAVLILMVRSLPKCRF